MNGSKELKRKKRVILTVSLSKMWKIISGKENPWYYGYIDIQGHQINKIVIFKNK